MSYTKNYYDVLGCPLPRLGATSLNNDLDLRKAYKLALLAAHPDKQPIGAIPTPPSGAHTPKRGPYSVDDVKEAYAVLGDAKKRKEYNEFLFRHASLRTGDGSIHGEAREGDFILGLEMLDLSDFETLDVDEQEDVQGAEWTRACRCGNEEGFRIREEELEDAEKRGEKEVLVGCEGCSLWVRVGFDVEED